MTLVEVIAIYIRLIEFLFVKMHTIAKHFCYAIGTVTLAEVLAAYKEVRILRCRLFLRPKSYI